jgi:hypothetical protein
MVYTFTYFINPEHKVASLMDNGVRYYDSEITSRLDYVLSVYSLLSLGFILVTVILIKVPNTISGKKVVTYNNTASINLLVKSLRID